ncbi:MAG: glutamine amidotransferase [Actinomycetota bacterium]
MKISLYHLYPEAMNLYGDYGNVLSIIKRCNWRGINVEVVNVRKGDDVDFSSADIIFMGGGQDRSQQVIAEDLLAKGQRIKDAIEGGTCALTICGAYQLFGYYFKTKDGIELPGIGIFDAYTVAGDRRLIGNVLIDCSEFMPRANGLQQSKLLVKSNLELVGFENHSGKTYLGKEVFPLGRVIRGYGNDGLGRWEGCRYLNAFGTYLHGPLLSKNPWFTDYLILLALNHRYGKGISLAELDDSIEQSAFNSAKKRIETAKTTHL